MREILQTEGLLTQDREKTCLSSPAVPSQGMAAGASPIPDPPICPGWLIAYRAADGHLAGGVIDRVAGTVTEAEYGPAGWRFRVKNGMWVPMVLIRSVAKTDLAGQVVAAWEVGTHGPDGMNGQDSQTGEL